MRITAAAKARTRERILAGARELLAAQGYAATTTRDVAAAASIATGTLFNYFASKEALAATVLAEALDAAEDDFRSARRGDEDLAEDLFAHVLAGLHRLAPLRPCVAAIVEQATSPLGADAACAEGEQVRAGHLETVRALVAEHRAGSPLSFVSLHLYWTLYLGVVSFWSRDTSPHQEQTLVLLDRSLRLFADSLGAPPEDDHGS